MSRPLALLLRALCLAVVLSATAAVGQTPPADDVDATLVAARKQLDSIRQRMGAATTLQALAALRGEATTLESSNTALAADLTPQVANVEARLAELGAAPTTKGAEDADLTARRNSVAQQRAGLDAQLRLARLLAIESGQLGKDLDDLRRTRFEAQIGERTTSILSKPFWVDLRASWVHDEPRLARLARNLLAAVRAPAWWAWTLALVGIGVVFALLPWLRRALMRFATDRLPHGRIRRSLLAFGKVLSNAGAVLIATQALYWTVSSSGAATDDVESLLLNVGAAVTFGAFVGALGRALLSPTRPSWRLAPFPDAVAAGLGRVPLEIGLVVAIGWSLEGIATLVGAELATTVAITCVFSLALVVVLIAALRRADAIRRSMRTDADATLPPRPLWHLALVLVVSGVLVVSIASVLLGYVALGSLLVKQVVWVVVVTATAYLLATLVDDACVAWLAASTRADEEQDVVQVAATPALRSQIAVLLSAVLRVAIALVALVLMVGPLGQGPLALLQRADQLREGISIGEMRILPGAVLQALAVLTVGIFAVRSAKTWFLERYLPTTSLDAGMRISTATLLGYAGMVFAVALALSALGIGIERVAWIASALSVGIGFGLQAVVQNFVSGVILLTERPVKVGDWVALGGVEGDIRRINVRATEIQMGDRSTVIVPNSEFITKVVRNVTHADPLGLVQLKLPMPLDTDAERVRAILLEVFAAHPDVLAEPPPNVHLDAIEGGNLIFSATASVGSPRQVGGVRSAVLFDLLARLRTAGVLLALPPAVSEPDSASPAS